MLVGAAYGAHSADKAVDALAAYMQSGGGAIEPFSHINNVDVQHALGAQEAGVRDVDAGALWE